MAAHDFWIDRLSDHLDGHLPADEAGAVAEHLAACAECRAVADDLAEVKRRARALGALAPPRDLWDDIRRRLDETPDVLDLTLHLDGPPPAAAVPRRVRSWGGAARAAATVALMLGAGAVGWGLRPALHGSDTPAGAGTAVEAPAGVPGGTGFAASGDASVDALGDDVAELERLLSLASDRLDPNTVRVLRKNLAIIQTAVAESRAALEFDPDNTYVRSHLENAVARQRAFVQQASRILSEGD